jgi:hypothetical protein
MFLYSFKAVYISPDETALSREKVSRFLMEPSIFPMGRPATFVREAMVACRKVSTNDSIFHIIELMKDDDRVLVELVEPSCPPAFSRIL